jgi:hypothetical protein
MATEVLNVGKNKTTEDGDRPAAKTTVKLSVDLHRKLRILAGDVGEDIGDYLDQVLRPVIERKYQQFTDRESGRREG